MTAAILPSGEYSCDFWHGSCFRLLSGTRFYVTMSLISRFHHNFPIYGEHDFRSHELCLPGSKGRWS